MKGSSLTAEVLPALLVGTARRRPDYGRVFGGAASALDGKADLKAAALLAQALRLARPAAPAAFVVEPPAAGTRRVIPEDLREPFVRLFGADRFALPPEHDLAQGMARLLDRLGLTPHPFDFHRLEAFLRAHSDRLGVDVLDWLERGAAAEDRRSYFDLAVLTDDNWTEATPARRERHLRERRRADPAAARAMVEAVFANEGADLRLRLLDALRIGLGPDDRPFLEGLAKDRAPKVRELAAHYLARLPGPDGVPPAAVQALARIGKETSGFFRKKAVIKLELPATVAKDRWIDWVAGEFAGIRIEPWLSGLGMTASEAVAAAGGDAQLLAAITLMAVQSRRFDVVSELSGTSVPLVLLAAGGFRRGQDLMDDEALALVEALLRPDSDLKASAFTGVLQQIWALTAAPVSTRAFDLLVAEADRRRPESDGRDFLATLGLLALIAPVSRRQAVRDLDARAGEVGVGNGGAAVLAWLDLTDSLERVRTHE